MNKFNWTQEDIMNSNLTDQYKKMLLAELEGKITSFDPTNTRNNLQSHLELGRNFREDMKKLQTLDPRMPDVSLNECLNYSPDDEVIINIPLRGLTPEALVSEVLKFFASLNNKEIKETTESLMNPKNGYLRIEDFDEENPVCNEVRGRCIKDTIQGIIFASYYMRKNIHDYTTLSHEVAHMLSGKLFGSNINPIVSEYLSEVEAYYFELLCANYINNATVDPNILYVAHNSRVIKSIDYMWDIRRQYILSKHLFKPSLRRLNHELDKIPNAPKVTSSNYWELYRFSTGYINNMVHSILVATDLYFQTVEDPEKGLELFKRFMTSEKSTIQELFSDANITYLDDDCSNFRNLHEKTKALKKLVK